MVILFLFIIDEETDENKVKNHPDVIEAVEKAVAEVNSSTISISQDMYLEALRNGVSIAEERRREKNPAGPMYVTFYM